MSLPELGISTRTFKRATAEANLEAIAANGLRVAEYDMAAAGLPSVPDRLPPGLAQRVGAAAAAHGVRLVAVTGAFNMVDPDIERREAGLRGLRALADACAALGTRTITLCTGSFDPVDMWRGHADNRTPEAWAYLLDSMERAISIADEFAIDLGIEPATANVVDSAFAARRLLRELRWPRLKIVIDPASLVRSGEVDREQAVLEDAFDLLDEHIMVGRARDVIDASGSPRYVGAGSGALDYTRYVALLQRTSAPLIVHGLPEANVPWTMAFLRALTSAGRPPTRGSVSRGASVGNAGQSAPAAARGRVPSLPV